MAGTSELLTGFNCVVDPSAEILILGSMPSVKSLEKQQYYAHPRNAFWKIIENLFAIPSTLPYEERLVQLKAHHIALWDVVHQCQREGSLDADIRADSVQVNDFKALFEYAGNIKQVYFNGGKAAELFKRHVQKPGLDLDRHLEFIQLPSTSPAHAALNFDQKLDKWHQVQAQK